MNDHDEETLASLQQANDQLMAKNHALVKALSRATQEMTKTKAQLNQLAGPPMTFATMVRVHSAKTDGQGVQHASAEVAAGARRMIVPIAANLQASRLEPGRTVLLNENMVVVSQLDTDTLGAVRSVRQVCDDGRLLVADGGGQRDVGPMLGNACQTGHQRGRSRERRRISAVRAFVGSPRK